MGALYETADNWHSTGDSLSSMYLGQGCLYDQTGYTLQGCQGRKGNENNNSYNRGCKARQNWKQHGHDRHTGSTYDLYAVVDNSKAGS